MIVLHQESKWVGLRLLMQNHKLFSHQNTLQLRYSGFITNLFEIRKNFILPRNLFHAPYLSLFVTCR